MSGGTVSLYGERDKVLAHLAQQQAAAQKRAAQPSATVVPIAPDTASASG